MRPLKATQYPQTMDLDCEFCQIVRGEQPARVVGDSPDALAFFPLRPVCPGHTIVIPKTHIRDLWADGSLPVAGLMQAVIRVGQAISRALRPDGMNLISSAGQLPRVEDDALPDSLTIKVESEVWVLSQVTGIRKR